MGVQLKRRATPATIAISLAASAAIIGDAGAAPKPAGTRPPAVTRWTGSAGVPADEAGALGGNLSGLAAAGADRLWAVRDQPSALLFLERVAGRWVTQPGWAGGRSLRYPGGQGAPDAEAVTVSPRLPGAVFVGAERDNDRPSASRNSILRYEIAPTAGTAAGPLVATQEWPLDAVVAPGPPNAGVEALAWIPADALATAKPDALLMAVGTEGDGTVRIVSLGTNGGVAEAGSVATGLPAVMGLEWDAERRLLWAACDNGCGGALVTIAPTTRGLSVTQRMTPPEGMASLNVEGLAITGSCRTGTGRAVWSDDSATAGHALREAPLRCAAPPAGRTRKD